MNIDTKALKGIIEEIEASKARQKGEAEFQREAIKRAVRQNQLDGKAIRIVLQRRAMGDEKRDEQDYYVHAYEMALGGKKLAADALANGATIREAAKAGRISTGAAAALAKGVQKSEKIERDPETGEITETREEGADLLAVAAEQPSIPSVPAEQSVTSYLSPEGEPLVATEDKARDSANTSPGGPEVARVAPPALPADDGITKSCGGVESRHAGGISGEVTTGNPSSGQPFGQSDLRAAAEKTPAGGISTGAAGNLAKVVQKSEFLDTSQDFIADADMPEQPPFLRRRG